MALRTTKLYILDAAGAPRPARHILDWKAWVRANRAARTLASDVLTGDYRGAAVVSTTFTGIDDGSAHPPLLWDTRIRGGHADGYTRRTATREQAADAHREALLLASMPRGQA